MQPFWNGVAKLIPHSIAPNMITLIGFLIQLSAVLLYLSHDTTLSKPMPIWMHVYGAVCLFIYQTLDACDGKHARATKQSSPLG